jgi:hypothetical protein
MVGLLVHLKIKTMYYKNSKYQIFDADNNLVVMQEGTAQYNAYLAYLQNDGELFDTSFEIAINEVANVSDIVIDLLTKQVETLTTQEKTDLLENLLTT